LGIKDRGCIVTHVGSIQRLAVKTRGLLQSTLIKGQSPGPIKSLKSFIWSRTLLPRWCRSATAHSQNDSSQD
jgi:hypothetical protein